MKSCESWGLGCRLQQEREAPTSAYPTACFSCIGKMHAMPPGQQAAPNRAALSAVPVLLGRAGGTAKVSGTCAASNHSQGLMLRSRVQLSGFCHCQSPRACTAGSRAGSSTHGCDSVSCSPAVGRMRGCCTAGAHVFCLQPAGWAASRHVRSQLPTRPLLGDMGATAA